MAVGASIVKLNIMLFVECMNTYFVHQMSISFLHSNFICSFKGFLVFPSLFY